MSTPTPTTLALPPVAGKLTAAAPLASLVWFKSGGAADYLFEPKDLADLRQLLAALDPAVPVLPLGLGSNLIIRDGGVPGVVVRLGKAFAHVERLDETTLQCGGGASGILVSSTARDAGIAGLEFLRSIPGTVGGFVRMNGGAYGGDVAGILVDCDVVRRDGSLATLLAADLHYSYRHSELPEGAIVVAARFRGHPGDPAAIQAEMDRISAAREASQPLRQKTGGSTFKNPDGHKAWELVDQAGCRGLTLGGAQVSEKHTNFLINTGSATSSEIEALGEVVRARVYAVAGVELEWEIQRVGEGAGSALLDTSERKLCDDVRILGCQVVRVQSDADIPECSYSIGLPMSVGQGEVIVFGPDADLRSTMIREVHRQCAEGLVLVDGQRISGLIEGHDCIVRRVSDTATIKEWLDLAIWYHACLRGVEMHEAYQIVWPGAQQGLFPWEEGCDQYVIDYQPALYEKTPAA